MSTHLRDALRALEDGDHRAALSALVAAWSVCRDVRVAALVDVVDRHVEPVEIDADAWLELAAAQRPETLRPLLSSITEKTSAKKVSARGEALAEWIDPRIGPALLLMLGDPPWRSNPAKKFYGCCLDIMVDSRDPRLVDGIEELERQYPSLIATSVGLDMQTRAKNAAKRLRTSLAEHVSFAMSEAEKEGLLKLEEVLRDELDSAASRARRADSFQVALEELIALVNAAPHDDGPRAVLADFLSERDDPRGEFIALQLQRADGRATPETRDREIELLKEHLDRWVGPIAPVLGPKILDRGFVAYGRLGPHDDRLHHLAKDAAWSTIEVLCTRRSAKNESAARSEAAVLKEASLGAVRSLLGFSSLTLELLPDSFLSRLQRYDAVGTLRQTRDQAALARWLSLAKQPISLRLSAAHHGSSPVTPRTVEQLVDMEGFDRLRTIEIWSSHLPEWVETLASDTQVETVRVITLGGRLIATLERSDDGFHTLTITARENRRGNIAYPRQATANLISEGDFTHVTVDSRWLFLAGHRDYQRPPPQPSADDMAFLRERADCPVDWVADGFTSNLDDVV